MDTLTLTIYGNLLSEGVPCIILVLYWRRLPNSFKWLTALLACSFLADLGGEFAFHTNRDPNVFVNLHQLFDVFLVSMLIANALSLPRLTVGMKILNAKFLLFALLNLLFIEKASFNTYTSVFISIATILLSVVFYYRLMTDLPTQQLHKMSLFWVISGLFFAASGKIVIYGVTHYLIHYVGDNLSGFWPFHNILSMVANAIILVGVWLQLSLTTVKA